MGWRSVTRDRYPSHRGHHEPRRWRGRYTAPYRVRPDERRYVCTSFEVFRTPDASEGKGFVTSEVLRDLAVGHLITLTLLIPDSVLSELPNPGRR